MKVLSASSQSSELCVLPLVQEALLTRSEDQEELEAELENCKRKLNKSRRKVAQLDGDLKFLMAEFEKQQAFSQPHPSQQPMPAAPQGAVVTKGKRRIDQYLCTCCGSAWNRILSCMS